MDQVHLEHRCHPPYNGLAGLMWCNFGHVTLNILRQRNQLREPASPCAACFSRTSPGTLTLFATCTCSYKCMYNHVQLYILRYNGSLTTCRTAVKQDARTRYMLSMAAISLSEPCIEVCGMDRTRFSRKERISLPARSASTHPCSNVRRDSAR